MTSRDRSPRTTGAVAPGQGRAPRRGGRRADKEIVPEPAVSFPTQMEETVNAAVVTPSGVRDGDQAALEGLCERRGASVLAYCREVCGAEDAPRAAAEAFARFRAAVVAIDDFSAIDPEALLLSATRHAAASLAPVSSAPPRRRRLRGSRPPHEVCPSTPELLVARAEGVLGADVHERLVRHLDECSACRGLRNAFRRGELVYREPGDRSVPLDAARTIVAALTFAAPLADHPPDVAGDESPPPKGEEDAHPEPPVSLHVALEAVPAEAPEAADEDEDEARDEPETLPAAGSAPRPGATVEFAVDFEEEEEEEEEEPQLDSEEDASSDEESTAPDRRATFRGLPRSRRPVQVRSSDERHRHSKVRTLVFPVVIVLFAVAGALAMAGVFGGDQGSPPTGIGTDDQLFPTAVLRAPARGTAAEAAAEIARQARLERRRAEERRALRGALQAPAATPPIASASSAPTIGPTGRSRDGGTLAPGTDGAPTAP